VNLILFYGVVILVLTFGSSSDLASAYGIAVTGDMVITSVLATILFWKAWKWSLWVVALIMVPLLSIELLFLAANATKIPSGGYVPILMAVVMVSVMWTWVRGSKHVVEQSRKGAVALGKFAEMLTKSSRLKDVNGTAVFLTSDPDMTPAALMHNIKHNQVLHAQNLIVTVSMSTDPYVSPTERLTMTRLGDRFVLIDLAFGYMEEPNVPKALALGRKQGLKFDIMTTSFFLNRRSFRSHPREGLPVWQEKLFISLSKSAADATGFYRLPTDRVVEIGQQLLI
jgi:KUP system potassium uptake protein